ncbi:MAG: hypothetical protein JW751_24700, partial [Polyangiaceae bacterium]|nr:hypothetical protein [Polyangiaceae bacterium]
MRGIFASLLILSATGCYDSASDCRLTDTCPGAGGRNTGGAKETGAAGAAGNGGGTAGGGDGGEAGGNGGEA